MSSIDGEEHPSIWQQKRMLSLMGTVAQYGPDLGLNMSTKVHLPRNLVAFPGVVFERKIRQWSRSVDGKEQQRTVGLQGFAARGA